MKFSIAAFFSGLVFAVGLGVAMMTQPDRVIAFLDVSGAWDPTLGFVMMGAIAVNVVAFYFTTKREAPILASVFSIPKRTDIDARLVGGAAVFGLGWGLAGYCPGPGIVSLASGSLQAIVFVAAMAGGMFAFHWLNTLATTRREQRTAA